MGLSPSDESTSKLRIGALFLLILLASATVPALATVYNFGYVNGTGSLQSLPVSLQTGTAGSSAIGSVANAATATATAGLTYYENLAAQTATPALDGSGSAGFNAASGSLGGGQRLTTASSPDVIYVIVSILNAGGQTVSGVTDGAGLTYTFRQGVSAGTNVRVETWYAIAGTTLTNDAVTVTLTGSTRFTIVAFGISGVDTAGPFDPSVTSAPTATGNGNTASTTITTSFPNDFIIGAVAAQNNPTLTLGAGFTLIAQRASTNNLVKGAGEYDLVTSTLSGSTVGFSLSTVQNWAIIGDALIAGKSTATTDTTLGPPGAGTSFTLAAGSSAFLWSPAYASGGTLYGGSWLFDLWASMATSANTLTVSVFIVSSTNAITATILSSGTTGSIPTAKTEVQTTLSGAQATIPVNGQIMVVLTNRVGGTTATIYWGTTQLTNFQTPNTYNYILKISNPSSTSYSVNLALASSSGIARLNSLVVSFVSPSSTQIVISSGAVTQSSGSQVTLGAGSTIDIEVVATASSVGSSSLVLSLKVQAPLLASYAFYTLAATVD